LQKGVDRQDLRGVRGGVTEKPVAVNPWRGLANCLNET